MPKGGSSRAVGVGAELRKLRISHGWTTEQVAEHVPLSRATLNRIELGTRDVTPEEVASILTAIGVKDDAYESTIALVRGTSTVDWLVAGEATSKQLASLIAYESTADVITNVAMLLVPGLLQTAAYGRALWPLESLDESAVEAHLARRMARQTILSRTKPPKLVVYLDENVIARQVGSDEVFVEQLQKLIHESHKSSIEIRLLPYEVGPHCGLLGPYTTLEGKRFKIAHVQGPRSSYFLEDPIAIGDLLAFNAELSRVALDEVETRARLQERVGQYDHKIRLPEVERV